MTSLASTVRPLWGLLEAYGHDPKPIFEGCGIDPAVIMRPDTRIPVAAVNAAWVRASSKIDDPSFGVRAGDHWDPSMFGALGYAWLASPTLHDAFERMGRYVEVVMERSALEMVREKSSLVLTFSYEGAPFTLPALADANISHIIKMCRLCAGDDFNPSRVSLFHSAPPDPSRYYSYFRSEVVFDANRDGFRIPIALAEKKLPGGNPHMASLIDQEVVKYLASLDRSKVIHRVKSAITEQLPSGRVSDAEVAEQLALGERTLQRRLRDEGTTFKDLLDETRLELAEGLLAKEDRRVTEVAYSLGFSEPSSFSRWYKRKTGRTPREQTAA